MIIYIYVLKHALQNKIQFKSAIYKYFSYNPGHVEKHFHKKKTRKRFAAKS